jgi:hypothetical protein
MSAGRHAILARLHFDPWKRQATRIALTCKRLIDARRLDLRLTRAANHSVLPSSIRLRT